MPGAETAHRGRRLHVGWFAASWLALSLAPASAETADCIVNAHSVARLGAAEEGVIAEIAVERGDRFAAGDLLVALEASEEEVRLDLARLRAQSDVSVRAADQRAAIAEERRVRLAGLRAREIAALSVLEEAQVEAIRARLEAEEARLAREIDVLELRAAQAALARKRVSAASSGVVTALLMSEGELYNGQTPILEVARIDPLHVETFLPVSRRPEIAAGARHAVTLETGETVEGVVSVIDPVLDAATGTFGVRLVVPNPEGAILAGQSCTVAF